MYVYVCVCVGRCACKGRQKKREVEREEKGERGKKRTMLLISVSDLSFPWPLLSMHGHKCLCSTTVPSLDAVPHWVLADISEQRRFPAPHMPVKSQTPKMMGKWEVCFLLESKNSSRGKIIKSCKMVGGMGGF